MATVLARASHTAAKLSCRLLSRPLSSSALRRAEGDTGSIRSGGDRHADTWSRREKAAEDMYIKEREKEIIVLLRQKIQEQEKKLAEDRMLLDRMEDQYGHQAEMSESREVGQGRGGGTMI